MTQSQRKPVGRGRIAAVLLAAAGLVGCRSEPSQPPAEDRPQVAKIELSSTAFAHGQPIPEKYTADGDDLSPPLSWSGLPEGTQELALICDDPDAPRGTWVHWVIYKIPADVSGLPEGIAKTQRPGQPAGVLQGKNSWPEGRNIGYGGPDPPSGKHRYYFKLYALDTALGVEPGLDKASLVGAMEGHVLGEGQLMGTYQR